ncbi:LOW QUALITY PROTEIN: hypothetical protein RJ639_044256 [Escallonia herrerae]|uniref:Protein FAR1-RELATED SEQUENCE n=1 Tax=Escallonia herrerae TaxID=1293975 RepID=A0AA88WIV5_9ASTE|nr:LOW QUALITY PROTEIN: hypothetical protein RJ639_044256 [Escallonia herrerae]
MQVTLSKKLGIYSQPSSHYYSIKSNQASLIYHHTIVCKSLVADLNNEGLKPSQITRVTNMMKPSEKADVTPRQCFSIIRVERKNNVGKECHGIIKNLQKKTMLDDSYYFAMDLGRDGSLRSLFWADGRPRASYAQFGDVVVFDVTYTTNKFRMSFAPFVRIMRPDGVDSNEKYDLKGNFWIQNMHNLRAHYAKSFLNDTFFAGMTTSRKSESIHSFFTGT